LDGKSKSVSLRRTFIPEKEEITWIKVCFGSGDVIKLLMSLNKITCDLVAGSFHCIVSKSPLSSQNGKHSACSSFQQSKRENATTSRE